MTAYKDELDVVAHNFNTTTLTVNGTLKIEGLEMLEVELDEDEVETQAVASGTAIFVENPILTGTVKFQALEAVASTDELYDLVESGVPIRFNVSDSNSPKLACSAKRTRCQKKPVVKRGKEADVVEWNFTTTYLKTRGGSYRLEAE